MYEPNIVKIPKDRFSRTEAHLVECLKKNKEIYLPANVVNIVARISPTAAVAWHTIHVNGRPSLEINIKVQSIVQLEVVCLLENALPGISKDSLF